MSNKVKHLGTFSTSTEFYHKGKGTYRLHVRFEVMQPTCVNFHTFYRFHLEFKGYKCRNWKGMAEFRKDLLKEYLTEQEVYEAMFNHWVKFNPMRYFSNKQSDGIYEDFRVEPIIQKQIKAF